MNLPKKPGEPLGARLTRWRTSVVSAVARERLSVISIVAYALLMFAGPLILSVGHLNLAERSIIADPSDNIYIIGSALGLQGFVISEIGGPDNQVVHLSAREAQSIFQRIYETPWTQFRPQIDRHGAIAAITAYVPERSRIYYFFGPPEILTNRKVDFWRIEFEPGQTSEAAYNILSATPMPSL